MEMQTHLPEPIRPALPQAPEDASARLDAALIAAHEAGDAAGLVALYIRAADAAASEDRVDAAAFYLTHAHVFALESGHPLADRLHARLCAMGRDE